jgi:AraC family transcriptional regulator of adaptative response / DNA-3-methyladenine glycosylase II
VEYTLIGADGSAYSSSVPGLLGGHLRNHGYGRLDCPAALRWIARGHYVRHRVFFADEATAIAAGYRPCFSCLPERYAVWKAGGWPEGLGSESLALEWAPGMLGYLGARAIPGVEQLSGSVYRRTMRLSHGPALIELDGARFRMIAGDSRDAAEALARARRLLGLDVDWSEARAALGGDALLGPLVAARPELRVPGTVDATELAVRAVVNQQVSLAAAATVLGRLAEAHGDVVRHWPLRLFPSADRLAAVDPETLPMPRARARALVAMCAAIAAGDLELRFGADPAEARAALLAMPGIGDWTASYIALRVLGDPDAFLPTDLGIKRALGALGCATDRRAVVALAERWRPWRSYAAQVLWAADGSAVRTPGRLTGSAPSPAPGAPPM